MFIISGQLMNSSCSSYNGGGKWRPTGSYLRVIAHRTLSLAAGRFGLATVWNEFFVAYLSLVTSFCTVYSRAALALRMSIGYRRPN